MTSVAVLRAPTGITAGYLGGASNSPVRNALVSVGFHGILAEIWVWKVPLILLSTDDINGAGRRDRGDFVDPDHEEKKSMRVRSRWAALLATTGLVGSSLLVTVPAMATPADGEGPQSGVVEETVPVEPIEEEETIIPASLFPQVVKGITPANVSTKALEPDVIGDLTIFGTTDIHGNVFNWDYFADSVPVDSSSQSNQRGMVRVASAMEAVRAQNGAESVLVVDNGDAIQGTPLTYLAALHPDSLVSSIHPMAEAFNAMAYDAQNLGNHEFNYGLEVLEDYKGEINAPLLGANVHTLVPGAISFEPYTIVDKVIDGKTVKVGVLGLVTPGVRNWDKAHVEGILEFEDLVLAAQREVPKMKADGADIIVALVHSGQNAPGVDWNPADLQENVATSVSTLVNDIDVVVAGHSHVDIPSEVFHAPDGDPVLYTQPFFWARSTSQVTLPIAEDGEGGYEVAWPDSDEEIAELAIPHYAKNLEDSPVIADHPTLPADHAATKDYVNSVIATNLQEMTTASSRYEDTPILDIIGYVMEDAVREGIAGTEYADLPVIAQTSPFSRTSVFPEGDLRVRDVAGLYIYDNTLKAAVATGAQLKTYLEWSARFFVQATEDNPWDPETHTNALYDGATRGIPDYNFDALTGPVTYELDITRPVGERVVNLSHANGTPVAADDKFIMAVNNYRIDGGGGYPVAGWPVVWDQQLEIRQLIIEYAQNVGVIDQANFHQLNWGLITEPVEAEEAIITLSASTAKANDVLTVDGSGWTPGEELELTLQDAEGEVLATLGVLTIGDDGSFSQEVTVPEDTEAGDYLVGALSGDRSATAPLTVTATQEIPTAVILVSPSTVEAGKTITVTGGDWLPGSDIKLYLGEAPVALTPVLLGAAKAGEDGTFTQVVTIPASTKAGHFTVAAVSEDQYADEALKVTAATVVTPDPEKPGEKPGDKPGTDTKPGTKPGGQLPKTGAEVLPLVLGAIFLVSVGGAGVAVARRRSVTQAE